MKLAALAILVAVPAAAEAAEPFYARYIAPRDGVAPCYARTYDDAHLADNPKQRVTRFFLTRSEADGFKPPKSFGVSFGFTVRGSTDTFAGEAACADKRGGVACSVEGDGGSFTLDGGARNGVKVTIDQRLVVEGLEGFSPNLAKGGDDRVLLLFPDPAEACGFPEIDLPPPVVVDPLAPQLTRPPFSS